MESIKQIVYSIEVHRHQIEANSKKLIEEVIAKRESEMMENDERLEKRITLSTGRVFRKNSASWC